MQTALRTTIGEFGTPYYQRSPMHRCQPGDKRQEEKKTAARRSHNDYLMGRILPIAPDYYADVGEEEKVNLTTEENFEYLYRSAQRYAQLAEVKLPFRKCKGSPKQNISNLCKILESTISENINLEIIGGRLHFCLFGYHAWPDYTLFWMPLDFTEKLPKQLKRITLEFIRRFIRHHGIQDITDTSYYEMARDYLSDYGNYDEEATPKEIKSKVKLMHSYDTGKAHHALERMNKRRFCANLEKEIQGYHPKKRNEQEFLELIKEGMGLISPSSPHILQYDYDWAFEESPDFLPLSLGIQILLTYSIDDELCTEIESYFSSDCQESYNITPVTTLILTPETDKLFVMDDYPVRFHKWFKRFVNHATNNF